MHKKFDNKTIEKKWQEKWKESGIYDVGERDNSKEKEYVLVELPYPSGNLHIGHWHAFAVPDIYVRYGRMTGKQVIYPMGFDAFGLPAENAAIKHGKDPKKWTEGNIEYMKDQLASMGASFSWDKTASTIDPNYYKWTQWMFTKFFEKDIAYRGKGKVNWCDGCHTVIANEQVLADNTCERCGTEVDKKEMPQWMLRITDYADRLVDDLDDLDWPEQIKESQRRWIGRSQGAEIPFILSTGDTVKVFTTRPDTLYGATYMVLAPEHELVQKNKESITNWDEVQHYIAVSKKKSEQDRLDDTKEKTGVKLEGITATNPASSEEIPVYIADYVLAGYGTGAIMAVPAHDKRDRTFALKYKLPIKVVIKNQKEYDLIDKQTLGDLIETVFTKARKEEFFVLLSGGAATAIKETGKLKLHSDIDLFANQKGFDQLLAYFSECGYEISDRGNSTEVHEWNNHKSIIGEGIWVDLFLVEQEEELWFDNIGKEKSLWEGGNLFEEVNFNDTQILVASKKLQEQILFTLAHNWYLATIEPGVLKASGEFDGLTSEEAKIAITKKVGGRMTNTYRLRDWSVGRQRYWGVPIPIVYDPEGKAHAVPEEHLPWTLPEDVDFTPTGEPPLAKSEALKKRTEEIFGKGWTPEVETLDTFVDSSWYFLRYIDNKNDDMFSSMQAQKDWMPIDLYFGGAEHTTMHLLYSRFWQKALLDMELVTESEPYKKRINRGLILGPDGNKMSKSKGNIIDPDEHVQRVGADTVKMYLAFMGPYGETANYPWDMGGIAGIHRFLERVNGLSEHIADSEPVEVTKQLHKTILKLSADIPAYKFNTAISAMMVFVNLVEKESITKESYDTFLKLLAPFAPHLAEELWEAQGNTNSIHTLTFPVPDTTLTTDTEKTIGVQINGKMRGSITLAVDADQEQAMAKAHTQEAIEKHLTNDIKKVIYVPGRILNIIV